MFTGKIAILGVGSELVLGQIANTNAQKLSELLVERAYRVSFQAAVADDEKEIIDCIHYSLERADCIFVTGGLGPTRDDFTRHCIAKAMNLELEYSSEAENRVREKLESRGVEFREAHKQQAYFPKNSEILLNQRGTADAFLVKCKEKSIIALPGPWVEIEKIWIDHLQFLFPRGQSNEIRCYQIIGLAESDVAARSESILAGSEISYRLHYPYVEVKVENPSADTDKKMQVEFQEYLYAIGKIYFATQFLEQNKNLHIVDPVTNGLLLEKLKIDSQEISIHYEQFLGEFHAFPQDFDLCLKPQKNAGELSYVWKNKESKISTYRVYRKHGVREKKELIEILLKVLSE